VFGVHSKVQNISEQFGAFSLEMHELAWQQEVGTQSLDAVHSFIPWELLC